MSKANLFILIITNGFRNAQEFIMNKTPTYAAVYDDAFIDKCMISKYQISDLDIFFYIGYDENLNP